MATVTLTSKGQLTIPQQLRDALGHGRLVLVPSKYEPEDLFRNRPTVKRVMTVEDMDRTIAAAADRCVAGAQL